MNLKDNIIKGLHCMLFVGEDIGLNAGKPSLKGLRHGKAQLQIQVRKLKICSAIIHIGNNKGAHQTAWICAS